MCKPALVLVRAYITPRTRLKPPYRAFNDHRKGKDPIYSQSLLDYLCRCLLCTDTPVADLTTLRWRTLDRPTKMDGI